MNFYPNNTYDNQLVQTVFGTLCIDKKRLPSSGLTQIGIPSFVAEWLLDKVVPGSGKLTSKEQEKVNQFVQKAFPRKDERNEIHFDLTQGRTVKVIALMQVRVKLNSKAEKIPEPLAIIPALNLTECAIPTEIIEQHKMLLRQGIWGAISLGCRPDGQIEILHFDPFQISILNPQNYFNYRQQFTTPAWRDLLISAMGYNSEHPYYTDEAKIWLMARLLPIVEANFHIMELAPKGTGKSFVFENISSKVKLVSGGKVTAAQLFIDGRTKEVGLLGRHDVLVLDEVQSLTFDNPDEIIGVLKNYLASGRYNRSGFGEISSDCSLVMLANIELTENFKPRNENYLVGDLPDFFSETAFLDRFIGIIPGWYIPKFKNEMASHQFSLKMDYFGEILLSLRYDNRFLNYAKEHTAFKTATVRDENAVLKSASGFLKLLYPHLELTLEDYERDCLKPACQLRQYIRNNLYYLDDEYRAAGRELDAEAI
ncbi:BREX system Lon protease-like protein BrxL [Spirulina major CS-329]|uniref:BREX system Lon protease-like protein BrxL n=1 Tax=Spirulina TaxID=1154 RepID=UPI00232E2A85|nr:MULTISPECIES: BREX system Lon protease-like protein BrxL [Spirulina]MDB9494649.1 BREX system Lon protease-like protein BrxL [Spirulina subsalsa CS-330]MDB9505278.1 BREX system Lon protease-like protein BrxL [Spirulina major CS-329]